MKEIQAAIGMKPRKRTWAGFYVANILAAYTAARTETIVQCLESGEIPTTAANPITANLLLLIDRRIAFDFTGKPLVPTAVQVEPKARGARLHLRSLKMKVSLSGTYKLKLWTQFAPMLPHAEVDKDRLQPWKI